MPQVEPADIPTTLDRGDVLLSIEHLTTVFDTPGPVTAVDDVSFAVRRGETLVLVGESGSGKSVTALSILRLLQPPGRVAGGAVFFQGRDLLALSESEMRAVRGAGISLIFQEPMSALNPVYTVGHQVAEALTAHGLASRGDAAGRAVDLLRAVRLTDPERRACDYPHQLSGGQRQRVMIAIALACRPPLVIADEPTTALDVTIQAQILELLREMKAQFDVSLLLITHDFGVVAETADRVAVMYAGRIVEEGPVRAIFRSPQHPYTRGLLASIPGRHAAPPSDDAAVAGIALRPPDRRLRAIEGTVPNLARLPPGCVYGPRCPEHGPDCDRAQPALGPVGPDQTVACYRRGSPPREGR